MQRARRSEPPSVAGSRSRTSRTVTFLTSSRARVLRETPSMNRPVLLASLAAVVAALTVSAQTHAPARPTVRCPATWSSDPVLVVDVNGATLAGPVARHLAVYSDGRATLAQWSASDEPGRVELATIPPGFVEQLRHDL